MRILIDLQSCQSGSRFGGIGRYSLALAKAMVRRGNQHDYIVLLNKALPGESFIRAELNGLMNPANIIAMDVPAGVAEIYDRPMLTRVAELVREKIIFDLNPDVVHISSLIEGLGDDVVTSVGLIYPAVRTAVTLYDLIPLAEPDLYLTNHILERHYYSKIDHIKSAGMLLAISDYSRQEGIELGQLNPDQISNISSAVDESFGPRPVSDSRRSALQKEYGITRKFLLYTSSFDSRKNHPRLIQAFAMLPITLRAMYQLVIVGNGWDGIYEELWSIAIGFGLDRQDVLFLGRIKDEDLLDLYATCSLFVFPSIHEGFGLPVLEAMKCGAPTIASNTTSLPEVLGCKEAAFDPYSPMSISSKIQEVLENPQFRQFLLERGAKHVARFSWDISADKAISFLQGRIEQLESANKPQTSVSERMENSYTIFIEKSSEIFQAGHVPKAFVKKVATSVAFNELLAKQYNGVRERRFSVGLVTSWNTRCGIASYAKNLVDHLAVPSNIFAPRNQLALHGDDVRVRRCFEIGAGCLDELYSEVIKAAVDVVSIQFNYGFYDIEQISKLIEKLKEAGKIVFITLHSTVDPPKEILDRSLKRMVAGLKLCDVILVHSRSDIDNLEFLGLVENVTIMPQAAPRYSQGLVSQKSIGDRFIVSTFGFFLPHKGLREVIQAVAILVQKGFDIALRMINAEYSPAASKSTINECTEELKRLGLDGRVDICTEYLDESEAILRLSQSDLVVFAYQETGESSSAAVRMALAAEVPIAVTPLSVFDDVKEAVYRLPGTSAEDIADGIAETISHLRRLNGEDRECARNVMLWLRANDIANVARHFENLAEMALLHTPIMQNRPGYSKRK